jgi:hypothetical protein
MLLLASSFSVCRRKQPFFGRYPCIVCFTHGVVGAHSAMRKPHDVWAAITMQTVVKVRASSAGTQRCTFSTARQQMRRVTTLC